MIKYEVREITVETKNGKNASEQFFNSCDQNTKLLASYDTLEEAKRFYEMVTVNVREMSRYYLHVGKCIEVNEYDVDGDWLNGGNWWEYCIPDYN